MVKPLEDRRIQRSILYENFDYEKLRITANSIKDTFVGVGKERKQDPHSNEEAILGKIFSRFFEVSTVAILAFECPKYINHSNS